MRVQVSCLDPPLPVSSCGTNESVNECDTVHAE